MFVELLGLGRCRKTVCQAGNSVLDEYNSRVVLLAANPNDVSSHGPGLSWPR
jgi:hypothetical protein